MIGWVRLANPLAFVIDVLQWHHYGANLWLVLTLKAVSFTPLHEGILFLIALN